MQILKNEVRDHLRKFSRSSRLQEDQDRSLGFLPFTHSPDIIWDWPVQVVWSSSWLIPMLKTIDIDRQFDLDYIAFHKLRLLAASIHCSLCSFHCKSHIKSFNRVFSVKKKRPTSFRTSLRLKDYVFIIFSTSFVLPNNTLHCINFSDV